MENLFGVSCPATMKESQGRWITRILVANALLDVVLSKRSINPALSAGGELRDACVHVGQRGHMRCRATQRYLADW